MISEPHAVGGGAYLAANGTVMVVDRTSVVLPTLTVGTSVVGGHGVLMHPTGRIGGHASSVTSSVLHPCKPGKPMAFDPTGDCPHLKIVVTTVAARPTTVLIIHATG